MKKIHISLMMFIALFAINIKTSGQCSACFTVSTPYSISACPGTSFPIDPTTSGVVYSAGSCGGAIAPEYKWSGTGITYSSTNTLSTTITVPATPSICTLQVTGLCGNIICNGGFESGDACIMHPPGSYGGPGCSEGNWNIAGSASACGEFCSVTPHSGALMYLVNGNCSCSGCTGCHGFLNCFWEETVSVCPNTNYLFSMWVQTTGLNTAASLPFIQVFLGAPTSSEPWDGDNILIANPGSPGVCMAGWQQYTACWYSGGHSGNVLIGMEDLDMEKEGNDFALDDISLQPYLTETVTIPVNPIPSPVFTILGPPSACTCIGTPYNLSINCTSGCTGSDTYQWADGAGIVSTASSYLHPGILGVRCPTGAVTTATVTNSYGCSGHASTTIDGYPPPTAGPITGGAPTECAGSSVKLCDDAGCGIGTWSIVSYRLAGPWEPWPTTGIDGIYFPTESSTDIGCATLICGTTTSVTSPITIVIAYTVHSPCANCSSTVVKYDTITIEPAPVFSIIGPTHTCVGAEYSLSVDCTSGCVGDTYFWTSTWSSESIFSTSNPFVHPALLTAACGGTNVISHVTVTNEYKCVTMGSYTTTICPKPAPGEIIGASTTCAGSTVDYSITGNNCPGQWSMTPATSHIGFIYANSATGTTLNELTGQVHTGTLSPCVSTETVQYTVSTCCTSLATEHTLTINPVPTAKAKYFGCSPACSCSAIDISITGSCGATVTYNYTWPGGTLQTGTVTLSSVCTCPATVTAIVSIPPPPGCMGISGDLVFNLNTVTLDGCTGVGGTSILIHVGEPTATLSVGPPVCPGTDYCFTVTGTPGATVYLSESPWAAAVDLSFPASVVIPLGGVYVVCGLVIPLPTPGTVTFPLNTICITKIVSACGCTVVGTEGAGLSCINVVPLAMPVPVEGPSPICQGPTPFTLYDGIGGGVWTASPPGIVTLAPGYPAATNEFVTGVNVGTTIITYSFSSGCYVTFPMTVLESPGIISGVADICGLGGTLHLTDVPAGGTWSITNTSIATIGASSGIVTSDGYGSVGVIYTIADGCTNVWLFDVNPIPDPITGTTTICLGSTTTLSDDVAGGGWSTGITSIAGLVGSGATGTFMGNSLGTTDVYYSLGGCSVSAMVTVVSLPPITGSTYICSAGSTTNLFDATSGGTWSSSDNTIATVDGTGVVTGVASGSATITYTDATTGCSVTVVVTVGPPDFDCAFSTSGDGSASYFVTGFPVGAVLTYEYYDHQAPCLGLNTTYPGTITVTSAMTDIPFLDPNPAGGCTGPANTSGILLTSVTITNSGTTCTYPLSCSEVFPDGYRLATGVSPSPTDGGSLTLVPNPNNGTFTIKGNLSGNTTATEVQIEVVDMLGQSVLKDVAAVTNKSINKTITLGETMANGSYLVRIKTGDVSQVLRFTLDR